MVTYEIRSKSGWPVHSYDNLERAKAAMVEMRRRVAGLRLVQVERVEKEIDDDQ